MPDLCVAVKEGRHQSLALHLPLRILQTSNVVCSTQYAWYCLSLSFCIGGPDYELRSVRMWHLGIEQTAFMSYVLKQLAGLPPKRDISSAIATDNLGCRSFVRVYVPSWRRSSQAPEDL